MKVVIVKQAAKELRAAPASLVVEIVDFLSALDAGESFGPPLSRPLPRIAKGLHEPRLSGAMGEYRVFYLIRAGDAIYVVHAASKKRQKVDNRTVFLLQERIQRLGL